MDRKEGIFFKCGKEGHYFRECLMISLNTQKLAHKITPMELVQGSVQKTHICALTHEEVDDAKVVAIGTRTLSLLV